MLSYLEPKRNSSGSISIQIIKKINGKSKVVESIGCSKDKKEIEEFYQKALNRIKEIEPNLFDISEQEDKKHQFISLRNDQIVPIGDELFFGKIFDKILTKDIFEKFYKSKDKFKLFKALVISRILYPGSKLYLSDYLHYFKKQNISHESIYKLVDTIYKDCKHPLNLDSTKRNNSALNYTWCKNKNVTK